MTGFWYAGRKSLGFNLSIELNLDVAWIVETDLISVEASKLGWFLCGSPKLLVFNVWIEINPVFVSGHRNGLGISVGIDIDLISAIRSKFLVFACGIEIHLVLV